MPHSTFSIVLLRPTSIQNNLYFHRYIQYAAAALAGYDGKLPLHHYLKQFFAADKKYGSKDRRHISHLCYCYYRLGKALSQLPVEERLKTALFLCNDRLEGWASVYAEEWVAAHTVVLSERIAFIRSQGLALEVEALFPWLEHCSPVIDATAFALSHLVQPDVFLRIRPGQEKRVVQVLEENGLPYTRRGAACIALPAGSKADQVLNLNKEVVVQDWSSQRIGEVMQQITAKGTLKIWDCCAASGGKSILARDLWKDALLTVSDVRPSIIHNLKLRFEEAGIKQFRSFVADLAGPAAIPALRTRPEVPANGFDLVICDAPCSGSGTWGRTPEQLTYFSGSEINRYATLQQRIIHTAVNAVAPQGYFLYITCSVFRMENETQVAYMQQKHSLQLVTQQLVQGYEDKADTLFAALFIKP